MFVLLTVVNYQTSIVKIFLFFQIFLFGLTKAVTEIDNS